MGNVTQLNPLDERADDATAWHDLLQERGKGFAGDERNVLIALRQAPELKGLTRYNEFSLGVELTRAPPWRAAEAGSPWRETDDTALQAWLQEQAIAVRGRAAVTDTVVLAAQDHPCHPVREYLERLRWDGVPRLKIWPHEYLNATGNTQYLAVVGQRFMVSAVARIFQPGCQADHVLIFEGSQGIGKTSATRELAVRPDWYAGSLPDVHSKDAAIQLVGKWLIELSELKAVRNAQLESIKAFITETADTFRPPYGRRTVRVPRQNVFIGTTNERDYLRDRTGNRRYWPIQCGRVNLAALIADRDQLWAEAVHEYQGGTQWHLTQDEAQLAAVEQSERVYISELEHDVSEYLARQQADGKTELPVRDVLVSGLNLDPNSPGYAETARKHGPAVAEALERAGWAKVRRTRKDGKRRTLYRLTAGQAGQDL